MTDSQLSPDLARAADKARLRRLCLEARDRIGAEARDRAALAVVPLMPALLAGAVVAGYWPIRSEFDPRPLMAHLAANGHKLALPAVLSDRLTLAFRRYAPGMALERAGFGLSVPPEAAGVADPDVLILPLAGFDATGHRLGYGAGHYDRALAALVAVRPRLTLGLGFASQAVDAVPAEPHDMRLDAILTEAGLIACGGKEWPCG
jgi:5-formyltetrahydrofolate cyclo-ligase